MFNLVIGGSASGKSDYAERLVCSLDGERYYIATMMPFDEETKARIRKHQLARADRGFTTIEQYTSVSEAEIPKGSNVLLECMSNLAANEMFSEGTKDADVIVRGIMVLLEHCSHLTIVTNEVFSGGSDYSDETLEYLRFLAKINRRMAELADNVIELFCGVPLFLKGCAP